MSFSDSIRVVPGCLDRDSLVLSPMDPFQHRKILSTRIFETPWIVADSISSLWNWTDASVASLPRGLRNVTRIVPMGTQLLRHWDFVRSEYRTSYQILGDDGDGPADDYFADINYNEISIASYSTMSLSWKYHSIFMPAPLGTGGIMFSGCPSVLALVRSSQEGSGHFFQNASAEWPEMWHADADFGAI